MTDLRTLEPLQIEREAGRTLDRLLPRLAEAFAAQPTDHWSEFRDRLVFYFPELFARLAVLYGHHYDFFYQIEQLLVEMGRSWFARSAELKILDRERTGNPHWFQSQKMLAAVYYVDLLAGDLTGLRAKIPYFQELGLTYLHLMPLFAVPAGENDGGYAISDYRTVDPRLGSMEQLTALASELRQAGISLCLDFVFNHTSDEHTWALKALAGDPEYRNYYFFFPDRKMPDRYEQHLREIFPDARPGSFTYRHDVGHWVWTTFNSFQWDLNYANPEVFRAMAGEMLFIANAGAEILRLDALAFTWKQLGTDCENLPQAHTLVQAFNLVARIAAPSLLFKSEAIVHPDEVNKYIGRDECQLSYNPLLMALLWNSLATREIRLLRHSMSYRHQIPADCAWVNYVRVHDDIGWTFDDGDAAALRINGFDHRRFLNAFYTGRFPGSFARGLPFQENPRTGDARISGTLASLTGLEEALQRNDSQLFDLAIRRIHLLYAIIFSTGGIPLIYLGDEVGALNDYSYRNDPAKAEDSRWVHRPVIDWEQVARRQDRTTVEGRIFGELHRLTALRQSTPILAGHEMEVVYLENDHIFAFVRANKAGRLLVVANFTEQVQTVDANSLRLHGLGYDFHDLISDQPVNSQTDLYLGSYQVMWLAAG
ncbi:MAG: alpha-glucosidase C-terminal domain-containing protein [Caldilineaceae bacterium]|nr:alpha-glucosidase C-terminal domain-containing protein [Caldilineaceae bacterium]